jgi:hypothetical protein
LRKKNVGMIICLAITLLTLTWVEKRVVPRAGGDGRGVPTRRAGAFSVIRFLTRVTDLLAPRTGGETRRQDPRATELREGPK